MTKDAQNALRRLIIVFSFFLNLRSFNRILLCVLWKMHYFNSCLTFSISQWLCGVIIIFIGIFKLIPQIQSDREVHGERAILHHLQLPVQRHPRHSVEMHEIPIRAPQSRIGQLYFWDFFCVHSLAYIDFPEKNLLWLIHATLNRLVFFIKS